ncbi:glycosyltransferase [Minwuia sp.]|uniref:glycosyltransferase n=1 Tax=Minwuia sp. TaxID=2493630 RepID=UPI003A951EEB
MTRSVTFVCINGTGMGHATRILAIARRLPEDVTPIIVSNSPALDAFELLPRAVVEHVPGIDHLDMSRRAWTNQLRREFEALLSLYRSDVVVQDGTAIFPWVSESVTRSTRRRRLVWIRRPMWRQVRNLHRNLQDQALCDLVLEPGELAAALDQGVTTRANELAPPPMQFVKTAPIRLLDQSELLDRGAARALLNLRDGEKAALVQLGAGRIERNWDAAGAAINALRQRGDTRIFLARWKIAGEQPAFGADVTVLDTYPLARLFQAFDLIVSAAGYNSFHEIMASDRPAIFIPNQMEVDDQSLRASFAAQSGHAEVVESRPAQDLPARVERGIARAMRKAPARPGAFQANGAAEAADRIAALVGR